MEPYTGFARVYDIFMEDTPYGEWAERIAGRLAREGIRDGLVADLGCGTGTLTRLLADKGYDMIGVDASAEMLQRAVEKQSEAACPGAAEKQSLAACPDVPGSRELASCRETAGYRDSSGAPDILYLCQDMRQLELYGTVRAMVSVCDSLNYLLEEADLEKVFRLVNNYLDPDGLFLFDFNTVYKYETIIGDATIAENREDCSFIWENYYHPAERINEYDLTIYVKAEGDLYRRFTETHYQRGYTLDQIQRLIRRGGMAFVEAYDADTGEPVSTTTGRICCVAREQAVPGKKRRL